MTLKTLPLTCIAPSRTLRVSTEGVAPSYTAGMSQFTPAATPTDVASLQLGNYSCNVALKRVVVSGIADTAATVEVLLQRSVNGGGGTPVAMQVNRVNLRDKGQQGSANYYTANRTSNGNGISSGRPVIDAGYLTFATATAPGTPYVRTFGGGGAKSPTLNDLIEWVVVNLAAQAMPANAKLSVVWEWQEEQAHRVAMVGDSTTSNATSGLLNGGANGGGMGQAGDTNSRMCIDNLGSNGFRLTDYLANTNGVTYAQAAALGRSPNILVLCYGLNDVRQGATTQAQLISMIDAAIYATLNGTTSGATYTSPLGANTVFTWPSTIAAVPDCRIILWGPNSLLADDPTSASYVTNTGAIAGANVAAASQNATDILYNAYQAFAADTRIFALVQKQGLADASPGGAGATAFPRTSPLFAATKYMTDTLHPNARGQALEARQIAPFLNAAYDADAGLRF